MAITNENRVQDMHSIEEQIAADVIPAYQARSVTDAFVTEDIIDGEARTSEFTIEANAPEAEVLAEGADGTIQRVAQTKVSVATSKLMVLTGETAESIMSFGDKQKQKLAEKSALGLALKADKTVLALASAVTNVAGVSGADIADGDIDEIVYLIANGQAVGRITGFINALGTKQLRALYKSTVSNLTLEQRGLEDANRLDQDYKFSVLGVDFYETAQIYNDGINNFGLIFVPSAIGVSKANGGVPFFMETPVAKSQTFERSVSMLFGAGILKQAGIAKLRYA